MTSPKPRLSAPIRLLACVSVALLVRPGKAQEDAAGSAAIRQGLRPFVEQKTISGAVGLVGEADGVIGVAAVGLRDVENDLPMTADTLFRVMSMTKPITASAILMLADEGRLAVDDPVEKHLPEFKGKQLVAGNSGDPAALKDRVRPITLRDLLTHTSGLPDSAPAGFRESTPQPRAQTLAQVASIYAKRPLVFEPGSKWAYSNSGMTTLGRVIEVASGLSYDEFLQKRFFDPLGMVDTTFYPTAEQMKRAAVVYGLKDGALTPASSSATPPSRGDRYPSPAGGLYSTASDMAKFYQMLLNRGTAGGRRYLSESAVAEMTKVQTGDLKAGFVNGMGFGLGVGVVREPAGVTAMLSPGSFGHGGAFGTQGWVDPKKSVFSVLMLQRTGLPNPDGSPMRAELQRVAAERGRPPP